MHRRHFLRTALGGAALAALGPSSLVLAQCGERTASNIEGPFHRPGAPFGAALGDGLAIAGIVRDTRCRPLRDAVIEVWQADPEGEYDLSGYVFRGRLRTDEHGGYLVSTATPGRYRNGPTFRPRHVHVKVHANGRPSLTTQLYFPGDPYNDPDPWFRSSLLLQLQPARCTPGPSRARFDFVV